MFNYSTSNHMYTYLWSKYRPAILSLMVASQDGVQKYKFLDHEFKGINAKEKGGYSFNIKIHKGRIIDNYKPSVVAKDLLSILQRSGKALELMETAIYEFTLDKQFNLHIEKHDPPEEEQEEKEEPQD